MNIELESSVAILPQCGAALHYAIKPANHIFSVKRVGDSLQRSVQWPGLVRFVCLRSNEEPANL